MTDNNKIHCSFCDVGEDEGVKIIAGPNGVAICLRCAEIAVNAGNTAAKGGPAVVIDRGSIDPHQLKDHLDQYVVGQERAKRVLSVAVANHYKRIALNVGDDEIQKSNVLLIGPTGSGKTHLVETMARVLDVPMATADATTLTESGYVGEDVDSVLTKLLMAADGDVEKAQHGIVFIDEIDKLAKRGENTSITRDVSGEGVQQALLKMIEGATANITGHGGRKNPQEQLISLDTSNILFICGGAFAGLEKIVGARLHTKSLGFGASVEADDEKGIGELIAKHDAEDLEKFGLIPEFIGRLPVVATLKELDEEALMKILTEPRNALVRQYQKLFRIDEVELDIDDTGLRAIAGLALKRKTGARGLRTITENLLMDTMFDLKRMTDIVRVTVNDDVVQGRCEPIRHKSDKLRAA